MTNVDGRCPYRRASASISACCCLRWNRRCIRASFMIHGSKSIALDGLQIHHRLLAVGDSPVEAAPIRDGENGKIEIFARKLVHGELTGSAFGRRTVHDREVRVCNATTEDRALEELRECLVELVQFLAGLDLGAYLFESAGFLDGE